MTLTNFFLLHAPHNGCTLPMSFEPPLVKGTTWSASSVASVSPQARHWFPCLSQIALNSSAVKLPGLACFAALLAAVVGLGLPDLLGVGFGPLLAAGDYFVSVKLVVLAPGSGHAILVLCRPPLLVLGYLLFVSLVVLSSRLDSMQQVCPGSLVLSVLFQTFAPVLPHARADAQPALPPSAVPVGGRNLELGEFFG